MPVTKVLAIGRLVTLPMTEAARKVLPEEVRDTVQLYLQGKIDLGIRPRVLSDLLGHRDPESIPAYVRIATETQRDVSLQVPT